MKVIAVLGSPHRNGPSSAIARSVLQGAKDAGHEVVMYEINEMNMRGCQACYACKQGEGCDCVVNDDLKDYWKDLHECGALIVTSPNYGSRICGPVITYMDRHYCVDGRLHKGIKLVTVFSQGAKERYEQAEAAYEWCVNGFRHHGMELVEKIVHTGKDAYDADSEIIRHAYEVGKNL